MTEDEKMEQVDTVWLEANYDRCIRIHEKLKDKMWCLTNGWAADFAWAADKPAPVPNPSMPWRRPTLKDIIHRVYVFETRDDGWPQDKQEKFSMSMVKRLKWSSYIWSDAA